METTKEKEVMGQMSLFDLSKPTTAMAETKPAKAAKKTPTKPKKPVCPEFLANAKTLPELLKVCGMDGMVISNEYHRYYYTRKPLANHYGLAGDRLVECVDTVPLKQPLTLHPVMKNTRDKEVIPLRFIHDGICWYKKLELVGQAKYIEVGGGCWGWDYEWKLSEKWLIADKLIGHGVLLPGSQSPKDCMNSYQRAYCDEMLVDEMLLMDAPWIETLEKAGYAFAKQLIIRRDYYPTEQRTLDILNRLCQKGSKPSKIFKTSSTIYKTLKEETDLEIWDRYRVLNKMGKMSEDAIVQCIQHDFEPDQLRLINHILGQQYEGKPVFSFDSLMNYLVRLDQFEAIDEEEALQLLSDYLRMCHLLEMRPRVDGDSLKREHDIAARNVRNQHNEIMARQMTGACKKLERFDFEQDGFFIRGIRDYNDLVDEAKQQHNCVASYAHNIIQGRSLIYVLRRKAAPEHSLVTVELSPGPNYQIRQKLMAYNRPIHNKSITDFLGDWRSHVMDVANLRKDPMVIEVKKKATVS